MLERKIRNPGTLLESEDAFRFFMFILADDTGSLEVKMDAHKKSEKHVNRSLPRDHHLLAQHI